MNNFCYIFLFLSAIVFNDKGCQKDERFFDTSKYHKLTTELKQNIHTIDSIALLVDKVNCQDLKYLDSIHIKQNYFCSVMERYNLQEKKLITLKDCVIKKEVIDLKTFNKATWFREEALKLDSSMTIFSKEVKSYKNLLKRGCLKNFNVCKELKKSDANKVALAAIDKIITIKNKPEEELYQDSVLYLKELKEYRKLAAEVETSPFYRDLLIALIEDIKFFIGHKKKKILCHNAHIRWADIEKAYITCTHQCEREYLKSISEEKWTTTVDSVWVIEQTQLSRKCAKFPKGCTCDTAINYDSLAVVDNDVCIGCMDPLAINYCPSAKRQDNIPCKYKACNDRCYAEKITNIQAVFPKYLKGRDIIVHDVSLCGDNLCGCTNSCAENFNPDAKISALPDNCIGVICGCLDSSFVNYALRQSPDWARQKYYNNKISKHNPTYCHNRGCTNPCAKNYDSKAIEDDGSCRCDSVTKIDLERMMVEIELEAAEFSYSPQTLDAEFQKHLDEQLPKNTSINFRKSNLDLIVDVASREMKIKSKGQYDGIPLGDYHFKPVNELIDALITFLNFKTSSLSGPMLTVKIIGEADAHPIRGEGIDFLNASRPINGERYRLLSPTEVTNVAAISQKSYDLSPNTEPVNMNEGNKISDNQTLAFIRGFMIKQKIKDAEPKIDEQRILIGAKVNTGKGKEFRRVAISLTLVGFYKVMGKKAVESSEKIDAIIEAIEFFEEEGYPSSAKTYNTCPCYGKVS